MSKDNNKNIRKTRLESLLGYRLRRAQSAVFADFMATMADEQVTPGQFGVLSIIHENPGLNQSTLARALGIERSTMVGVIDGLQARGIVERRKSDLDRRAHALNLTPGGAALMKRMDPKVSRHEKAIASKLSAAEIKQLMGLLEKVAAG